MNRRFWRDWEGIDLSKARENKLTIPQEFADKCLEAFPDDQLVKELLEEQSFALVVVLDRKKSETISNDDILAAKENGTLDELAKKAKSIKDSLVLFKEIYTMYEEQYVAYGNYVTKDGKVVYQYNLEAMYRCSHNSKLVGIYPIKGPSKRLLDACDYSDACRAAGLDAAAKHIASI